MSIYSTNKDFETFSFDSIVLTKPGPIENGNYFIKFLIDNNNLYTQPPKCVTRNGIINVGKKWYIDLMFTNIDEQFIQWVENLESYCVNHIYNNREKWFDSDMELHDIENYFSTPMKVYKSGKYYILRVNIANHLGKPAIKVYDEEQNELPIDAVKENQQIMSVIEFKGIKCSARSFQIEIELKQLMTLTPTNLFDSCVFGKREDKSVPINNSDMEKHIETDDIKNAYIVDTTTPNEERIDNEPNEIINDMIKDVEETSIDKSNEIILPSEKQEIETELPLHVEEDREPDDLGISEGNDGEKRREIDDSNEKLSEENISIDTLDITPNNTDFEEVKLDLEELPEDETFILKNRKDVYYEMYREARRKAKIAKDMAMASYLEAKNIKNTYMLDDIEDSDISDFEMSDSE
jgi:hypothetical protein